MPTGSPKPTLPFLKNFTPFLILDPPPEGGPSLKTGKIFPKKLTETLDTFLWTCLVQTDNVRLVLSESFNSLFV